MVSKEKIRQDRYCDRQAKAGLKRMNVWIPVEDEEKVKRYVERLRKEHARRNLA